MTLLVTPFGVVPGQVSDTSIRGAFIATQPVLPFMARVNVELQCGNGKRSTIPVYVCEGNRGRMA